MHKPFCDCNEFPESCLKKIFSLAKKGGSKVDKKLIEKAFFLGREAHEGQCRASKEPYFSHPLETAAILAELGLSSEVIAAALLHDVLEDTDVTPAEIKKLFGNEILLLVEGVTKLDLLTSESRKGDNLHNLYGLLLATTRDPRVILIKLADKLHNLRTLHHLPKKDRLRISKEALEIYVPIADRIGLEELSTELKDLAFKEARPETFKRFEEKVRHLSSEKEKEINLVIAILRKKLKGAHFYKKHKSVYGIYTKMQNTGKGLHELNDSVILIVVVKDVPSCYGALGTIHGIFPPLPNKLKDFIAAPKPSFYRVLQTTVFGSNKKPVKIRISTPKMHLINRQGVIAYRKLFGKRLSKYLQQNLSNLGLLLNNGRGEADFLNALKLDFLTEPIYVFTTKGNLVELSKKSTVLDFAFATEKNWALHLSKASVNGKEASFNKVLESGNVVELHFSKKPHFSEKWLGFAHNFLSKEAIKKALKTKD